MRLDCDVAIVGSGFSGSLLAMIARRLGHSVAMIERGAHPRFAIGESSTPLANLLLEQIAATYDLPRLRPLCEWGSWQKSYPEIACGLKRGFTFYHHEFDRPWERRPDRANELLVAASPHDEIADTHWYRADFDHFLMREAQALEVDYLSETNLRSVSPWNGGLQMEGEREGSPVTIHARFVADATGPNGFLFRALGLSAGRFSHMPTTEALYTHFEDVHLWDEVAPTFGAPYPVDDAAVHLVFPGGWIWVLRFDNGITSAGVAMATPNDLALDEEGGWERLLARLPTVGEMFAHARPVMPFVHVAPLSFQTQTVVGPNWALLPSAAGFIDPLLSTGFPLTLLGIQRLAKVLERLDAPGEQLKRYENQTLREIGIAEEFVGALYRNMDRSGAFNALALLYFAAASFTETAHRLGRPELAGKTFLLAEHSTFGPGFARCVELGMKRADPNALLDHVLAAIEPIDAAGLSDLSRRNSYDVRADDLRSAAAKFDVSVAEVDAMLARCGFVANARAMS